MTTATSGRAAPADRAEFHHDDGRARVVVVAVSPSVDNGRFPVKRVTGEALRVTAEAVCDGHEVIRCALLFGDVGSAGWTETPMEPSAQDRWSATVVPGEPGRYEYLVIAWVDRFSSWQRDLARRRPGAGELEQELEVGARLALDAASAAEGQCRAVLEAFAERLRSSEPASERREAALEPAIAEEMRTAASREHLTTAGPFPLVVDPPHALFGAWYEFFPRSAGPHGKHGTFADAERMPEYIAGMGFDIVHLPPIHPIGRVNRKGKHNVTRAAPGDVGSPWAIGSAEGGHCSVHPELGTLADLRQFVRRAEALGLRVALDIAFQCSPDHPWVAEHPEWFRRRPDGSIRHAENPPKRYEDIVPFDFETSDWEALWQALLDTVLFWVEQGITTFRVDNPHTKPLGFWEWLIGQVKGRHPEAVFLSEAFTRPSLLEGLAKRGFSQSYTYFAWRNTAHELQEYLEQLTQAPRIEYLRPNLWPNTPDILTEYLQNGGRPAFMARLALAATLGASYGIYGPAFELCEATPREPGSEEYLDSEKYQLRTWNLNDQWSLRDYLARINATRKEHPALQQNRTLLFHDTDNAHFICYSKTAGDDVVIVIVNLDPHHTHRGHVTLKGEALHLDFARPYQVHDLLGGGRYLWTGPVNFVELSPGQAHILALRRRLRTEHEFDYYQ